MPRRRLLLRSTFAWALCALLAPAPARAGEPSGAEWQQILEESGIRVFRRETGNDRLEFRAEGLIKATLVEVTAVLRDFGRHDEWMEGCSSSDVLRYPSAISAVGYHRMESPGPFVSDRDVVIEGTATYDPETHVVRLPFHDARDPRRPPIDGVVRMPALVGLFEIRAVDEKTSHIEYRLAADPGGSLPDWLVNLVFRRVPLRTIERLREQVNRPGYEISRAIVEATWALSTPEATAVRTARVP